MTTITEFATDKRISISEGTNKYKNQLTYILIYSSSEV